MKYKAVFISLLVFLGLSAFVPTISAADYDCSDMNIAVDATGATFKVTLNNWDPKIYLSYKLVISEFDSNNNFIGIAYQDCLANYPTSNSIAGTANVTPNSHYKIMLVDYPSKAACIIPTQTLINPNTRNVCSVFFDPVEVKGQTFKAVPQFKLCSMIPSSNTTARGDCASCLGNEGVWTAIGCLHFDPKTLVNDSLKIGIGIGGGLALLLMIYGAFLVATSAGDPEAAQKGKEVFGGAIAGLLFIIFSAVILKIIGVDILQIPGL
jgi:hypothetical protein